MAGGMRDRLVRRFGVRSRNWAAQDALTLCLVVGTFCLFGVSLFGTCSTIAELKKSNRQAWRPFLTLTHNYTDPEMYYVLPDDTLEGIHYRKLFGTLSFDDSLYDQCTHVGFYLPFKPLYRNIGSSPMRITAVLPSALYEAEWDSLYSRSSKELVEWLLDLEDFPIRETDLVVMANDSGRANKPIGTRRMMPMSLFEEQMSSDSLIRVYPFSYVQYQDSYGQLYDLLLIERVTIRLGVVDGSPVVNGAARREMERCNWDIMYP